MAERGKLPGLPEAQATDLSEVARTAEAARIKREREAEARRIALVQRWDRGMHKLFKGILTRKDRHRLIFEAGQRREATEQAMRQAT